MSVKGQICLGKAGLSVEASQSCLSRLRDIDCRVPDKVSI